jgi:hypothetical protein
MSTVILVTVPSSGIAFEQDVNETADNTSVTSKKMLINLLFILIYPFVCNVVERQTTVCLIIHSELAHYNNQKPIKDNFFINDGILIDFSEKVCYNKAEIRVRGVQYRVNLNQTGFAGRFWRVD